MDNIFTCCICNKKFKGFSNNAQPLDDGECCDSCNSFVIDVRLHPEVLPQYKKILAEAKEKRKARS